MVVFAAKTMWHTNGSREGNGKENNHRMTVVGYHDAAAAAASLTQFLWPAGAGSLRAILYTRRLLAYLYKSTYSLICTHYYHNHCHYYRHYEFAPYVHARVRKPVGPHSISTLLRFPVAVEVYTHTHTEIRAAV